MVSSHKLGPQGRDVTDGHIAGACVVGCWRVSGRQAPRPPKHISSGAATHSHTGRKTVSKKREGCERERRRWTGGKRMDPERLAGEVTRKYINGKSLGVVFNPPRNNV